MPLSQFHVRLKSDDIANSKTLIICRFICQTAQTLHEKELKPDAVFSWTYKIINLLPAAGHHRAIGWATPTSLALARLFICFALS